MMKPAFASLCCLLLALSLLTPFLHTKTAYAELIPVVPEVPFALIENDGVFLYGKDEAGNFYKLTSLPKTYFALETEDYDTEYYQVAYADLTGFLKKAEVTTVDYEPVTKFAVGSLSVTADVTGVNLRARPDHALDNVLCEIKRGQTLTYYGTLTGSAPIRSAGDTWYYVKYTDETEPVRFGYIYAPYATAVAIPENKIEKVLYEPPPPPAPDPEPLFGMEWTPATTAVFLILLCLPAVLVMLLLFKKPDKERKKTPRSF